MAWKHSTASLLVAAQCTGLVTLHLPPREGPSLPFRLPALQDAKCPSWSFNFTVKPGWTRGVPGGRHRWGEEASSPDDTTVVPVCVPVEHLSSSDTPGHQQHGNVSPSCSEDVQGITLRTVPESGLTTHNYRLMWRPQTRTTTDTWTLLWLSHVHLEPHLYYSLVVLSEALEQQANLGSCESKCTSSKRTGGGLQPGDAHRRVVQKDTRTDWAPDLLGYLQSQMTSHIMTLEIAEKSNERFLFLHYKTT